MGITRTNGPSSGQRTRSGGGRARVDCRDVADPVPADAAAGGESYDEMLATPEHPRRPYRRIHDRLQKLGHAELRRRPRRAQAALRDMGITFTEIGRASGRE